MTTLKPLLPGQVIGPYADTLIKAALQLGISKQVLADAVAQPLIWIDQLPAQITTQQYLALMACGAHYHEDFGLRVGRSVRPGSYPIVGFTVMSCATLRDVIEQVMRFEGLNHDLGCSRVALERQHCAFIWEPNDLHLPDSQHVLYRHVVASVFAGLKAFSPWLLVRPMEFTRVDFRFPRPADAEHYQQLFGCPVFYEQPCNRILVAAEVLDWQISSADSLLFETLHAHAQSLLQRQQDDRERDVLHRLRQCLVANLPRQEVKIDSVAGQLHMSARTLQRKLRDLDTTYQQVLDRVRLELADNYLRHSRLSISEIAFLLGYQEQSSFNHAFKDWTGKTPRHYRYQVDFGNELNDLAGSN